MTVQHPEGAAVLVRDHPAALRSREMSAASRQVRETVTRQRCDARARVDAVREARAAAALARTVREPSGLPARLASPGTGPLPSRAVVSRISLPPVPTSAALARQLLTRLVALWEFPVDVEAATLLLSETVTNAVRHAATPVLVVITQGAGGLRVDVVDSDPTLPTAPAPLALDLDAEGGRGMALVAGLADEWGVTAVPPGKSVWFQLARTVP